MTPHATLLRRKKGQKHLRTPLWPWLCVALSMGCSSSSAAGPDPDPPPDPELVLGVPAGDDGLDFAELEPWDELQLETFFQGGTHVSLAVRCVGLGQSAFIHVTVRNLASGAEVEAATSASTPRRLACRDEYTCDLIPLLVMMSGIAESEEELNGLKVEIHAEARNEDGDSAEATRQAELRTDNLDP